MKSELIRDLLRRFIELVLSAVIPSIFITFLAVRGLFKTYEVLFLSLSFATILFLLFNIWRQRCYYVEVLGDMRYYYATLIPYGVFALIIAFLYFVRYDVYVWLFSITKFLVYIVPAGTTKSLYSNKESILIFLSAGLLVICLSYLGLIKETRITREEIIAGWETIPEEIQKELVFELEEDEQLDLDN